MEISLAIGEHLTARVSVELSLAGIWVGRLAQKVLFRLEPKNPEISAGNFNLSSPDACHFVGEKLFASFSEYKLYAFLLQTDGCHTLKQQTSF